MAVYHHLVKYAYIFVAKLGLRYQLDATVPEPNGAPLPLRQSARNARNETMPCKLLLPPILFI
jgi:hypothetical protein